MLDVGVSSEKGKKRRLRNYFLKTFRYPSQDYTGLGIQGLTEMDKFFPGKTFVQYPGGTFPFEDKEFDWVFSNAVIEHVGNHAAQVMFVNEMLRVAHKVFFTTPYKYFPVESHSNLIFLHWNDNVFNRWRAKHQPLRKNLYLFSRHRLESIMKESNASPYKIQKNRLLGLTMTLTVVCSE